MLGKRLRWAAARTILASHGAALRGTAETPYYVPAIVTPGNPGVLGRPIATSLPAAALQRPIASADRSPTPPSAPLLPEVAREPLAPVGFEAPGFIVRGQAPDGAYQTMYQPPAPPPPPPPGGAAVAPPYGAPEGGYIPGAPYEQPLSHPNGFFDRCRNWFGGSDGHGGFNCKSDCAYEGLISPVSNPFHDEDPRSLTEIKPLFIFQDSPSRTPFFNGGNSYFYGLQGRVALNDRWSIVLNKFGFVTFDPKDTSDGISGTGFAEVSIGPKFTFLHNTSSGTVAAFGLNFELPIGSSRVGQDTGTLSLDPYFTIAQSFGRSSYGTFNVISTTGYDFSTSNERSDFFHTALHLDYDVASAHKWYPLVELNYYHYTNAGQARNLTFEGVDLGNFGSSGDTAHNDLNMAVGFRYKFSEHFQAGVAAEFPLISNRDIEDFRMTLDFIFRY